MPSTEQQPREGTGEVREETIAPDFTLSHRDVRRKRPPAMAFLLKLGTLRKVVRVCTLGTLDFFGIYMALLTALTLKAGLTSGDWNPRHQAAQLDPRFQFAFLVTVLLFARSGLYSSRGERPGMTRIVSSLFQVAVVAFVFVLSTGDRHQYDSYYLFYGSLFFPAIFLSLLPLAYPQIHTTA